MAVRAEADDVLGGETARLESLERNMERHSMMQKVFDMKMLAPANLF